MSTYDQFKKSAGFVFKALGQGVENFLENFGETLRDIFEDDSDRLISREAAEILSNPVDKKIYMDALEELRDKEDGTEKTITLSSGRTETIFIHHGPTFFN